VCCPSTSGLLGYSHAPLTCTKHTMAGKGQMGGIQCVRSGLLSCVVCGAVLCSMLLPRCHALGYMPECNGWSCALHCCISSLTQHSMPSPLRRTLSLICVLYHCIPATWVFQCMSCALLPHAVLCRAVQGCGAAVCAPAADDSCSVPRWGGVLLLC
jgi:hypothetical protein